MSETLNMSNICYILHIGYNGDMDIFFVFAFPIIIVAALVMWMFEDVQ
jgi:hypothetical protein